MWATPAVCYPLFELSGFGAVTSARLRLAFGGGLVSLCVFLSFRFSCGLLADEGALPSSEVGECFLNMLAWL